MSRKLKKIKKKVENVYYKSFDEVLEVSAILKCLATCFYGENNLKISDIELIVNVIQQKMRVIQDCIDDLSLI